MRFRFFTIPIFDSARPEAELNRFLSEHAVLNVDRQLVNEGLGSVWTVCVSYVDPAEARSPSPAPKSSKVDYREVLSESDFALFSRLRDLRKRLAEEADIPAYGVFSNEQLATFVTGRVTTKAAMSKVNGVGASRLEKFGPPFLELLRKLFASETNGQSNAPT